MSARGIVEDCAYFTRRAREERELAKTCADKAVARAHRVMADEYAKRAKESVADIRIVPL